MTGADHPLVRERLCELISQEQDLQICGEAEDVASALKLITPDPPDLLIMDLTLKGGSGLDLLRALQQRAIQLPVLVLSMHDESIYAESCIRAGAKGYLNKQYASKDVIFAIRSILAGEIFLTPQMQAGLLQKLSRGSRLDASTVIDVLSSRERQVFEFLGRGMGVSEIAKLLLISVKTVEAHREHIRIKLDLQDSQVLLRFAIEYGAMHAS